MSSTPPTLPAREPPPPHRTPRRPTTLATPHPRTPPHPSRRNHLTLNTGRAGALGGRAQTTTTTPARVSSTATARSSAEPPSAEPLSAMASWTADGIWGSSSLHLPRLSLYGAAHYGLHPYDLIHPRPDTDKCPALPYPKPKPKPKPKATPKPYPTALAIKA